MSDRAIEAGPHDVAVVGMAARLPGAQNVAELWANLRSGTEAIRTYSDDELRQAGVSEEMLAHPDYVKAGAPLDGMEDFDAGFFGFSPKEAAVMDPQHRHFLEVCWEALEDAGRPPERFPGAIGVFAGSGMQAYFAYNILSNPQLVDEMGLFLLRHTGNDKDFLTTRVSYCLDLKGPSVNIQTACSTSLVAVHAACQSLLAGECDLALAGGVTIELPHCQGYLFQENEILSPDGHCRAFDADSAGTVFGSGAGVVVLRRLADAIADGDPVRAVIAATAVNNDGAGKVGYLAPSVDGHAEVVAEALALAELEPAAIGYVEAHGTGTPVGDPIEVAAFHQAFGTAGGTETCALGSIKTHLGHLDTAAGVASLIKAVHCVAEGEIPPSLGFRRANPEIDFAAGPFFVNTATRPWRQGDRRRYAGVSSLGVGGTNAHAIVAQPPPPPEVDAGRAWQLLVFSGKSAAAADGNMARLGDRLADNESGSLDLADVAFTLQRGRAAFAYRRAIACRDVADAAAALAAPPPRRLVTGTAAERPPEIAFLFPGGGAQHPGMGRELYAGEPVYREAVDRCLGLLADETDEDMRGAMLPATGDEEAAAAALERPLVGLPALFACEYALAELLAAWGIEPAAMAGHSLGEYTAACRAGVFSLAEALRLVTLRARLFETLPPGGMTGVPLGEAELTPFLADGLSIAALNGPAASVVAGEVEALAAFEERLAGAGIEGRRLHIDVAAHSPMLEPILGEFRRGVAEIALNPPSKPWLSNLTGTWVAAGEATEPEYWVRHLRHTVRFGDGLAELLGRSGRLLLEVGPGTSLTSLVRAHPDSRPETAVAAMHHPSEPVGDRQALLSAVGRLWVAGCEVDWPRLHQGRRRRLPLPTYAFDHARYWIEPGTRALADESPALSRSGDPAEWVYAPHWLPAPRSIASAAEAPSGRWLIFAVDPSTDAVGAAIAAALRTRLEAAGAEVAAVREGDAFHRDERGDYVLAPELGRDGYDALAAHLAAEEDATAWRVIHLWTSTASTAHRRASSYFHQMQERGFFSLLHLAQACAQSGVDLAELTVVTHGLESVAGEGVAFPEKATLLGPLRVLPREIPGLEARLVDIQIDGADLAQEAVAVDELAERLVGELGGDASAVAWRGNERYEAGWKTAAPPPREAGSRLRKGGVYLVTGGIGGVGLELAEHLARTYRARLILVSRTALPGREEWDEWVATHGDHDSTSRKIARLAALEAQGGEVMTVAADVANIEEMGAALAAAEKRFGAPNGVFHAAGVLDDGVAQLKTDADVERVLAPKVQGTLVLAELLAERRSDLDFLLLFSSTSGVLGPAGQVDYAAANAFLDAFAARRDPAFPTFAVAWGVWKEAGMGKAAAEQLRAGVDVPPGERWRVAHPVLRERVETASETVFVGELDGGEWLLAEHRLRAGDRALLPGTAYLELARAAVGGGDGAAPGSSSAVELREVRFVSPLEVATGAPRRLRVSLSGGAGDGERAFKIDSRADGEVWSEHAAGLAISLPDTSGPGSQPASLDLAEIAARCPERRGAGAGLPACGDQEPFLAFGPRWQSLVQVDLGRDEALAELELDAEHAADLDAWPLHPALLDVATSAGLRLIPGYRPGAALYVPLGYDRVRIHARLPARPVSWVRSADDNSVDRDVAVFDVLVADTGGRVVVEVEGLTLKRLTGGLPAVRPPRPPAPSAPEKLFLDLLERGIETAEGMALLDHLLGTEMPPRVVASPVPLPELLAASERAMAPTAGSGVKFARPDLAGDYEEPRDELERELAAMWEELLGVDRVGIRDDFFALGGHSLIAVRLFGRIQQRFHVEYPLSVLFEASTVEQCAALLRAELGDAIDGEKGAEDGAGGGPRYRYLVPLHAVDSSAGDTAKRPFFIVSGMLGNVLNLRHLAGLLGGDQPVWALQARGLYGEAEPHRRFEDMARDYLGEIRDLQPRGPYFLGGYSGGGITAYEMAQQLLAAGEEVGILVMLDTRPATTPGLTGGDRVKIQWLELRRRGPRYVVDWVRKRWAWEMRRFRRPTASAPANEGSPALFRSEQIEAAFLDALGRYETRPYPGRVTLLRPPLEEHWKLGPDRAANSDRRLVDAHNHWDAFVRGGIDLHVVSGGHNSMVLEPHVRVLAARLRPALEAAQGGPDLRR